MYGTLTFQTVGPYTSERVPIEETTREFVVGDIERVKRIGYQSDNIYHLDGSITLRMHYTGVTPQGTIATSYIIGRFEAAHH